MCSCAHDSRRVATQLGSGDSCNFLHRLANLSPAPSICKVNLMKTFAALFLLVFLTSCGGGGATSTLTSTPTSVWAGTYTGQLNFSGCPNETACGGDSITIAISEAPDPAIPSEFLPTLTITGIDNTSKQSFTGTGTALYYGAAPTEPGSMETWASITISLGYSLDILGSGSSTPSSSPVLIRTGVVSLCKVVNGSCTAGSYLGTLTRQ